MAKLNGGAGDHFVPLVKAAQTSQVCSRCHKLLIVCTCGLSITPNGGNLWGLDTVFTTGFDSDDLLPGKPSDNLIYSLMNTMIFDICILIVFFPFFEFHIQQ